MIKNVNVVDHLGNRYVPTYVKRAKGLVKNGRARWVDASTICLACPPDDSHLEDGKMENIVNSVEKKDLPEISTLQVDVPSILARMDRIIAQGDALIEVVRSIKELPINESPEGGHDGAHRAEAIGSIYSERERTNQKMLDMLQRVYEDAKPAQSRTAELLTRIDWVGVQPETAGILLGAMNREMN